jgi:hypothetical protein
MQMVTRWPTVVSSFCVSEAAKKQFTSVYSTDFKSLLLWRAWGMYSLPEYRRWIRPRRRTTLETVTAIIAAKLPGMPLNVLLTLFYSMFPNGERGMTLQMLKDSPFYIRNWRVTDSQR